MKWLAVRKAAQMALNELALLLWSHAALLMGCTGEPGSAGVMLGFLWASRSAYQPSGVPRACPQAHSMGQAEPQGASPVPCGVSLL